MRVGISRLLFRSISAAVCLFLLATAGLNVAQAQTVFGRISGTVSDSAGAVLPGVTVTVTNESSKLSRSVVTDEKGDYLITNLPVGNYTMTAERQGFKKALRTGFSLVADGRLTSDFTLETGDVTETVNVTSTVGETVNITSGEVARVIDRKQVQTLALNGRNYVQLASLIPGSALLDEDQLALTTSLSISQQAINGNRSNYNSLTVDGGFNMDSGSNNSQVNNVGIDFIQEVNIKSSNFSAEYGRNAGAAINVVTRSGGDQYHGSVFEFFRNDKLDAANFFTPINNGVKKKGKLRFNDGGWTVGGPIIKDKLFFFGGQEYKYISQSTAPALMTLPSSAELGGDFSKRLAGPDGLVGTADDGVLKDPTAGLPCTAPVITNGVVTTPAVRAGCFNNNIIPSGRLTTDGKAIASVYRTMAGIATGFNDAPVGNNATFQLANPFKNREDLVRIDYTISPKHTIYGRYIHDKFDLIDPLGTFSGSNLPTTPTNRLRPGYSVQVSYTWIIDPKLINEAKFNTSWNGQRIPPVGDNWKRSTFGFAYPQIFTNGGRFEDGIPDVNVTGFANFRGPAFSLLSPTTDISISDNVTWIHASHSIKTGIVVIRNRKDQNGRSSYTGVASFSTAGNTITTTNALADALLGNFRTYSEAATDPIGFFRFTQTEAFVNDTWKVSPHFSLEAGLRYQHGLPTYTAANNMVNFDPSRYDPAQAVTIKANGTIDTTKGGNPFNGLIRAGDGVPADQLVHVPNGNSSAVTAVPAGAPRGFYNAQNVFGPRFGFAWSPFKDDKTSVRGGFGMFYDKPEGNLIFSQLNIPPFSNIVQFENGNLASPSGGAASAAAPLGNINALDPHLRVPYTMNASISVQRELPRGFFVELAVITNQARHLIRQPDINQPTFEALAANAALPTSQQVSTNALRPFKGYSQILMRLSDSTSNYNAFQVYVTKRKGNLNLTGSYTWSKSLTDTSGNADNPEDPFNRKYSYGPSSFDRRHILVGTYTYSIPFMRDKKGVAAMALANWELSGITRFQTGGYFTATGNTSIGTRRADFLGGDPSIDNPTNALWFDKTQFVTAPNTRRGTSGVGNIQGPGLKLFDLSLRKQFRLTERVSMRFQADFFNMFNIVNFRSLQTVVTNTTSFGTLTAAGPSRNIQFGLRFEF